MWLVEFAALADVGLVPQAVAYALEVHEQAGSTLIGAISDHLLNRHALLILDNCEHLVIACAQLVEILLQACPGLRILATSRENLDIPGETVWNVPPLSLPEPQPWRDPSSKQNTLLTYKQSEAVQLIRRSRNSGLTSIRFDGAEWGVGG